MLTLAGHAANAALMRRGRLPIRLPARSRGSNQTLLVDRFGDTVIDVALAAPLVPREESLGVLHDGAGDVDAARALDALEPGRAVDLEDLRPARAPRACRRRRPRGPCARGRGDRRAAVARGRASRDARARRGAGSSGTRPPSRCGASPRRRGRPRRWRGCRGPSTRRCTPAGRCPAPSPRASRAASATACGVSAIIVPMPCVPCCSLTMAGHPPTSSSAASSAGGRARADRGRARRCCAA